MRAGGRDLPVLALVAARAMARQPFGTVFGWPLAIFGWPMWLAMLNLLSGNLWHLERRAMIAIRARETSRFPALHLLDGPLVIGAVMGVSLVLWPTVFWLGVGSVTAFLLVNVGSYPGRLVAGPRVSHENPPLFISATAAEHQGSGLSAPRTSSSDRPVPRSAAGARRPGSRPRRGLFAHAGDKPGDSRTGAHNRYRLS